MKTATKNDWKIKDMPPSPEPVSIMIDRGVEGENVSLVKAGFIPKEMEDKWFIYYDAGWIFFHSSWSGVCVYKVKLEQLNKEGHVLGEAVINNDEDEHRFQGEDKERDYINQLIDQFLLKPRTAPSQSYTVIHQEPVKRGFHNLEKAEQDFLTLAVVEQKKYTAIEAIMGVAGTQLSKWWEDLKGDREELSAIRKLWKKKCEKADFWDFYKWHTTTERKCRYCGITESKIFELEFLGRLKTKRLTTRGKSLEIERIEPNRPYDDIQNLTLSCYWCNNAKTDEFTEEEFKPIGKAIGKIWEKRLHEEL